LPEGVYGDGDNVAQITVDVTGVITDITIVPITHPAIPEVISDMTDVDTAGLGLGDHLEWDGANWVPMAPDYFSGDYGDLTGTPPSSVQYINDLLDVDTDLPNTKDYGDIMFWNKDTQLWEAVKPYYSYFEVTPVVDIAFPHDINYYIDPNNYRLVLPEGIWEVEAALNTNAIYGPNSGTYANKLIFSCVYNTNAASIGLDGTDVTIPQSQTIESAYTAISLASPTQHHNLGSTFEVTVPPGATYVVKPIFKRFGFDTSTTRQEFTTRNIRARFIRNI
jgi:hypothetical protein